MTWASYHQISENHAIQAELHLKHGNLAQARRHFSQAAAAEQQALDALDPGKRRTLGITTVSAAALWYKAAEFQNALRVAYVGLARDTLPEFATSELKNLLQTIWSEELLRQSHVEFTEGEVLVAVSGGEVVIGGAPLDLIMRKVDEIGRFVYRTIEMLLHEPFRRRGMPKSEIQDQFRAWLFQAPAGSYQFVVRVRRPQQLPLFPDASPDVDQVARTMLQIIKASIDDPDQELRHLVADADYRNVFLKFTRNLAPTGTTFGQLEIKAPSIPDVQPVVLQPVTREIVNKTLRDMRPAPERDEQVIKLEGVLRGLQLDKDWIELTQDAPQTTVRIHGAGDAIDDVIGPMVNHRVDVEVTNKRGTWYLRDIQPKE